MHLRRRRSRVMELCLATVALITPLLMDAPCTVVIAATWVVVPLWIYQLIHGLGPQAPWRWAMPTSTYCAVASPPRMRARQRTGWILWILCVATALCWAHGVVQLFSIGADFVNGGHAAAWLPSVLLLSIVCTRASLARRAYHRELEQVSGAFVDIKHTGAMPRTSRQIQVRRSKRPYRGRKHGSRLRGRRRSSTCTFLL